MQSYEFTVQVFCTGETETEAEAQQLAEQFQNAISVDENAITVDTICNLEIQEPQYWESGH